MKEVETSKYLCRIIDKQRGSGADVKILAFETIQYVYWSMFTNVTSNNHQTKEFVLNVNHK